MGLVHALQASQYCGYGRSACATDGAQLPAFSCSTQPAYGRATPSRLVVARLELVVQLGPSERYFGSMAFSGSMLDGMRRPAEPTYAALSAK